MTAAGTSTRCARRVARAAAAAVLLAVSGCTAGSVMSLRPAVDVGTTAAVPHVERRVVMAEPILQAAPPALAPVAEPAVPDDSLYQAQLAAIGSESDTGANAFPAPAAPEGKPLAAEEEEQAVAMLAPPPAEAPERIERPAPVAEPAPQPIPVARAEARPQLLGRVEERPKPILAGYPRVVLPRATGVPAMPAEEVALRRQLKRLGVKYQDLPPIHPGGACGIAYPVKVSALSGGIQLKAPATLNATMAVTFARYVQNDFAPAVRWRYLSGISVIYTGSTYDCRRMIGERTKKISEHAKGNAIDVMKIKLDNGTIVDVTKPGFFSFRQRGFLNRVRAEACGYFTTVLGPGYNRAHANHFHFDLMQRRSGYVACR